jgi:DNA-binding winged helix-turn-helix (wHTH) protein
MRAYNTHRRVSGRAGLALVEADSTSSHPAFASIHLLGSASRTGEHRSAVRDSRTPPLPDQTAELVIDVDGLAVLVRLLVRDMPAELPSDPPSKVTDIHALLSRALEKAVDRMRGPSRGDDNALNRPHAASSEGHPVRQPVLSNETALRVGPLQLDLLDRTAKRGDRLIDLRPREFRLLKYMMQRNDKLLTRAALLKDVWNYKFVPETNLVDVHMGRLRRKVDGPDEAPLIRNVRGAGFVLSAVPCSQGSLSGAAERSAPLPTSGQHARQRTQTIAAGG